jgi:ABC-type multidrug transport system fused ATPase/permease subunit
VQTVFRARTSTGASTSVQKIWSIDLDTTWYTVESWELSELERTHDPSTMVPLSDDDEVSPSNRRAAIILSVLTSVLSFIVGAALFVFPAFLINRVFSPDGISSPTTLELTLTRLSGGLFLSMSLTSLSLLVSSNYSSSPVNNCRVALGSHAMLGLFLFLVGLLNDRLNPTDEDDRVQYEYLIGSGALFLVISCIGLMASFWPVTTRERPSQGEPQRSLWCPRRADAREGLLEPLLNELENDTVDPELSADADAEQEQNEVESGWDSVHDSSRIQGTKRLIKLAAPQMGYLYLGCAVLLVRLPFSLAMPHFVSTTLGALSRGEYHQAQMEILLLFILGSIDAVLDFWCVFLFGYAKERIVRGVRVDLMAAILRQDISFFDRNTSGDLSSRLSSDCGEMAGDLTWFFRFSIESVFRITGIAIYMVVRCPTLGGCALSIVPVVAVVNKLYGNWLSKNAIQVQDALAQANSVAQEAFACVRTVIAFAAEDSEHRKYSDRIDEHYRLNILQLMMTGIYYMVVSTFLINTVVQSALLLIGTVLISQGRLTSEILLAFMLYQGQLQSETMNLFNSYSSLIKSSGAGDKVFRLLDRMPPPPGTGSCDVIVSQQQEASLEDEQDEQDHQRQSRSSVQLRDVRFVYSTRPTHQVLNSLNLNVPAGSTTALVGSSGCGKSTIVSLLNRFYDPISGSILIDDKDLRSLDIKEHRRHIGVVTQEPVLFTGSILSNITYGCQDVTLEAAMEAAKLANAHDFVISFPDGYDTEVGERGVALSG